ncbi:ferredoxin reductase family protein [Streptomyces aurantiogriseus]|uniref:Ferric reductase n=1 Tax=Streptomyces aurantiogriseus TaxID=66870 RepID=A0A918EYK7_9ACTN|nr:ferredoxin reductase family protein [Streptomyces aurantiogriseus]GGQ90841.1 ferric reductase [Streptomyces aurantiogriseus]
MTTVHREQAPPSPPSVRRRPPAPLLLVLLWAGVAAVVALWWQNTGSVVGTAGWLTAAGRISGLLCGYSCAVLVGLMARVPLLERRIGSDRVARWHAMAGRYTICLLVAHVVLIIAGYAALAQVSFWEEANTVVFHSPRVLPAALGTIVLFAVGLISARVVRRRVSYEFWYYLHLLTYAAVFLSFGHQIVLGAELAGNPVAKAAWFALYLSVLALVVWFRVLTPMWLNLRHRLRVGSVHREAPGVWSVVIRGRRLEKLGAEPGRFFRWRFLTSGMWWTSTPYSLSAPPDSARLRITVKALGDHSTSVPRLRPGTRVWAEGPYGALTADRRTTGQTLLIAAGAGITPLRALFETLPGEVTLLYRAHSAEDLALAGELESIARARGAKVLYALNAADGSRPRLSPGVLHGMVPELADHDVYLCGPSGFAEDMYEALRAAGVPDRRIHHESFEL